ncbi:hypothetical protein GHT07_20410 [Caenimonas koreensis DSM 17982]|uniref:Lipoprotein n=1 Tax=Caenimonas koreensis DSM 17982 TaxID=1121255 RepID=A0A844B928_9BURK|nr:hypothetical protein [Caenimonas koreensis]MRD49642.1 hypothetical protein [Caenimonas koreensis DSM 17982]
MHKCSIASPLSIAIAIAAGVALVGCSTPNTYLVYRDAKGAPDMQVDYPNSGFCKQVEAVAAGNVKCEGRSVASELGATATLYYDPPGLNVTAHYPNMSSCERANSRMAMGVKLLKRCAPKG